jgi:transposase-like protein
MTSENANSSAGKPRRYPLVLRLRILQLLFAPGRKRSFTRRVALLSRRFGPSARQIFRWVKEVRAGGADGLRDHLRCDLLIRRAPSNLIVLPADAGSDPANISGASS